jgi:hypothetical protein
MPAVPNFQRLLSQNTHPAAIWAGPGPLTTPLCRDRSLPKSPRIKMVEDREGKLLGPLPSGASTRECFFDEAEGTVSDKGSALPAYAQRLVPLRRGADANTTLSVSGI